MKTLMYGSDPEFFLGDRDTKQPIPCVGIIPGTKDKPHMVDGFGLQEDNVMVEFTTPPAATPVECCAIARRGLLVARDFVRTKLEGRRVSPMTPCYAEFDSAELFGLGPQAMMFGCSPDFDAYNNGARHPLVSPAQFELGGRALRFAGGHVHIGYKDVLPGIPEHVVAMLCDLTIGLTLSGVDLQGPRRALYGKAGRYRPTPYGIEYRTISNSWVVRESVNDNMCYALGTFDTLMRMGEDSLVRVYNEAPWNDVRAVIESESQDGTANAILEWLRCTYLGGEEDLQIAV